jgi:hypothetical protein
MEGHKRCNWTMYSSVAKSMLLVNVRFQSGALERLPFTVLHGRPQKMQLDYVYLSGKEHAFGYILPNDNFFIMLYL